MLSVFSLKSGGDWGGVQVVCVGYGNIFLIFSTFYIYTFCLPLPIRSSVPCSLHRCSPSPYHHNTGLASVAAALAAASLAAAALAASLAAPSLAGPSWATPSCLPDGTGAVGTGAAGSGDGHRHGLGTRWLVRLPTSGQLRPAGCCRGSSS